MSDICRAEQLRALRLGKRVLPVRLEHNTDVPLYLETKQYLHFDLQAIQASVANSYDARLPAAYVETYITRPALPPGLVRRPLELANLRGRLIQEHPDRRVALVALRAQGGIGKSVLASMLFDDQSIQAAYPDGLIWVQMGQNTTELQILERIQEALRVLTPDVNLARTTTLTSASNQLRTALKTKHALLILDDLWDARHLRHFVFHEAVAATILLTTRDEYIVRSARAVAVQLDKLQNISHKNCLLNAVDVVPPFHPKLLHPSLLRRVALSLAMPSVSW